VPAGRPAGRRPADNPDPEASRFWWNVFLFEVADTDAAVARAADAGGTPGTPEDFVYGRLATVTDPFGAEFSVGSRPKARPG
jgi:uncharacterized protein